MSAAELDPNADDVAAIADVVRAYFGDPEAAASGLLGGRLLEWVELKGESPSWSERYEHESHFESAHIVELHDGTAIVDVRASHRGKLKRGSAEYTVSLDGPATLEKLDGRWRIVDFTMDGRRRRDAIVFAGLAEQEHSGVTALVLGVDRTVQSTQVVVELENAGATEVRLERAFVLARGTWHPGAVDAHDAVAPGASRVVALISGHVLAEGERTLGLALSVRSQRRRIPFVLNVPLVPPAAPLRQAPPRRLPILQLTWPRWIAFYAAVSALAAWRYGWFALGLPAFLTLVQYHNLRRSGVFPQWLYRARLALDLFLVAGAVLLFWLTPAAVLAVPTLVGVGVFLALRRLHRRRYQVRVIAALTAALAWLFVLGGANDALSPCRLADGSPSATADTFARALLAGDVSTFRRYEQPALHQLDAYARNLRGSAAQADRALQTRSELSSAAAACHEAQGAGVSHCYVYRVQWLPTGLRSLGVDVGCHVRSWRVDFWY